MENLPNTPALKNLRGGKGEAEYSRSFAGYEALKGKAALVDRSYRMIFRLTGKDSMGMLNAILTSDVPKEENLGTYAALLNPKGRIQTDLRVLKSDEDILVDTEPEGSGAAREILTRYAPFSRVKVEDLSEGDISWSILGLYGPHAAGLLGDLQLAEHEAARVEIGDAEVLTVGVAVPVPGFDLVGPADALRAAEEHLTKAGAKPVDLDAYETARIAAGIPRFGADITPENFPAEAGILDRAVSFSKGCYPGQETVARMRYRGHPNKALHRFAIEGPPTAPDTPIFQNEKQIGRITSIAPLPVSDRYLALGYLSRNARLDAPLYAKDATVSIIPEGKDA